MSTILGVEKGGSIVLVSDTLSCCGSLRDVNAVGSKVVTFGRSLVGVAGFTVYGNILRHYAATKKRLPRFADEVAIFDFFLRFWRDMRERYSFVDDQSDNDDRTPFADLDSDFLIVNKDGLFRVHGIMSVSRFERFCAIGSGADHTEGALEALYEDKLSAREIAVRAARAALTFDANSGGDLEVFELRKNGTWRASMLEV